MPFRNVKREVQGPRVGPACASMVVWWRSLAECGGGRAARMRAYCSPAPTVKTQCGSCAGERHKGRGQPQRWPQTADSCGETAPGNWKGLDGILVALASRGLPGSPEVMEARCGGICDLDLGIEKWEEGLTELE